MSKVVASAIVGLLLLTQSGRASTPVIFPPGQQLTQSSEVVIAIPRAISCRKQRETSGKLLVARVTVIWEVLVSWKGRLHVGDRFTSREIVYSDESGPCFYRYDKAMLLYLRGDQPYGDVFWYPLEHATDQLKELDAYRNRLGR